MSVPSNGETLGDAEKNTSSWQEGDEMARIWAKYQYYSDTRHFWDGHIEHFSQSVIEISFMDTLSSSSWVGIATGQFRQSFSGEVTGTVTDYTFSYRDTLTYSFHGASLSADRLFRLMESDSPELMAYVLSQSDQFDLPSTGDIVRGLGGNDTINGNGGADRLSGNGGNDILRGGIGADNLQGGYGHDLLQGDSGNDVLLGGVGSDTLIGGYGADHFVFTNAYDSRPDARDRVWDFHRVDGDAIDISAMDADLTVDGDQAFHLIGTQSFGHLAGELRWQATQAGLYVSADLNGDARADFSLFLANLGSLRSGDIIL